MEHFDVDTGDILGNTHDLMQQVIAIFQSCVLDLDLEPEAADIQVFDELLDSLRYRHVMDMAVVQLMRQEILQRTG